MKKLIRFEYHKLFQKKALWCFLVLCMVIDVFSLYYQIHTSEKTMYNLLELSDMYQQYDLSTRDAASLEDELFEMNQALFDGGTGEQFMKEFLMLGVLSRQTALLETYDTYLDNIEVQAEERLNSGLFAQPGSFSYRNLQKTPQAYRYLHDVNVFPDFDGGVLLFARNRLMDAFLIIIAFLIVIQIFVAERENGTWPLIKSMKMGHFELLSAKFMTAFSSVSGVVLIFYGLNYLVLLNTIGYGDTGRAIQSVDGYFSSVFPLSVHQYMVLQIFIKIIGILALCAFFAMLCLLVRGSVLAALTGVGIWGVEIVLWYGIYENSYLGPLKYLNIIPLLVSDTIIANYSNMNFFSYPVSNLASGFIMFFFCFVVGMLFSYFLYENENALTLSRRWKLRKTNIIARQKERKRKKGAKGLWLFEAYKQMIIGKGVFVLLVFAGIQVFMFFNTNYYIDSVEFYYRAYAVRLEGTLSVEKEHYLEEEEAAFQERESERLAIMERCENGEIDEMYRDLLLNQMPSNKTKHNALLQVNDEYHMLKDLQEKEGLAVEYVYRTPWKALLEEKAMKKYALQLEIALLTMLLVLSSSGAIEKGSSMDKLITVSVTGRKGVLTRKVTLSLLLATLVMLCSLLPGLVKIFHTYGVYGLSSPAASYFARNIFLMEITLGVLLLLIHLLFYLIILFATLVLFFISEKIGNRIAVLLIGTVLFLIPTLAFILV